jgi:hypothetical protein
MSQCEPIAPKTSDDHLAREIEQRSRLWWRRPASWRIQEFRQTGAYWYRILAFGPIEKTAIHLSCPET